jgi:hypothetical protein
MTQPKLSLVWTAEVDVGEKQDLGAGPLGQRYIVPILGGRFEGPTLRGRVLAGGADRQCLRPDGVRVLDALYEMQSDDGHLLTVHNRVIEDEAAPGGRYVRSVVQVQASHGPHAWLGNRVLVGALHSLRPARQAVQVMVYLLE